MFKHHFNLLLPQGGYYGTLLYYEAKQEKS